jgi:hypothetical protein
MKEMVLEYRRNRRRKGKGGHPGVSGTDDQGHH